MFLILAAGIGAYVALFVRALIGQAADRRVRARCLSRHSTRSRTARPSRISGRSVIASGRARGATEHHGWKRLWSLSRTSAAWPEHRTTVTRMPSVAIIIPVLDRPQRVKPLVENLDLSVAHERAEGWDARIVFVCSLVDLAELTAVHAAGHLPLVAEWAPGEGDYAKKINLAASVCDSDWYLTGADDLRFHPGWLRAAVDQHIRSGALVIGTNDLHNPSVVRGLYATHSLVHRDYVKTGTIDEPGKILHEGYSHNCCDTELVETAKSRGTFAFARDSHVEHLHHIFRGAPDDATYAKGRANHRADKQRLAARRVLWTRTAVERRRVRLAPRR